MKKLLLLLYLFSLPFLCFSQQEKIDSLKNALTSANDTLRVNLLLEISKSYVNSDQNQAIAYANQAKALAEKIKFPKGAAYAYKNIGLTYYLQGNYTEVLYYWQQSLRIFVTIEDNLGISNILNNIGAVYFSQGDDPHALEYYLKSLAAAERISDKHRIASAMGNIGAVYYNQVKYDKALSYYFKSLQISKETGNMNASGTTSANIGEIYLAQEKNDSAIIYFNQALQSLEDAGNTTKVAYSLNNLGKAYTRQGNYKKALEYQQQALAKAQKINASLEIAQTLLGLGETYSKQGKIVPALDAYTKARQTASKIGSNHELKDAYEGLALNYARLADYANAYRYQALLTGIKDTLYNTETSKKIINLQANYEDEKKQAQIDLLTKDRKLQLLELQREKLVRNSLIAGLFLILVLAFVLFRNNQIKVKANRLLTLQNEQINQQKEEIAAQRDNLEQTYNDLKNAQEQLIRQEKLASIGQLTKGIMDRILNPINYISNFSLMSRNLMKECIQILNTPGGVVHGKEEVEDLLKTVEVNLQKVNEHSVSACRIVRGMEKILREKSSQFIETDINKLIEANVQVAIQEGKKEFPNNQVKVTLQLDSKSEKVRILPAEISTVLTNLLDNAYFSVVEKQKTRKGIVPEIVVKSLFTTEAVQISIQDNGKGIPPKELSQLFAPFFTTKPTAKGTGLGLYLSQEIIKEHKGVIEVDTQEGEFTTFTIRIPKRTSTHSLNSLSVNRSMHKTGEANRNKIISEAVLPEEV